MSQHAKQQTSSFNVGQLCQGDDGSQYSSATTNLADRPPIMQTINVSNVSEDDTRYLQCIDRGESPSATRKQVVQSAPVSYPASGLCSYRQTLHGAHGSLETYDD